MICANDGCNNEFEKTTYNQKYCSDECCREATNAKIKKKYLDKKARLSGEKRVCSTRGCKTLLVRYNEDNICEYCVAKKKKKDLQDLWRIIGHVPGKFNQK